ncbi:succinate dehydrogenase, hydrophobic membrane anchor protein [Alcaligenaceae bacterium]|nr:succinate dehydrogenase, hydrophobic membrane anchor protein [Alcaligenaceae bacterium]
MSTYPGQDSLRTPLKVARRFGSARLGVHHWWLQRLTAIALIPLSIWFLFFISSLMRVSYETVLALIAQPVHAFSLIVLSLCIFWHGALGLQVIIEDYVHTRWLELTLQIAVRFGAILTALACVLAVLVIWLGLVPN